MVDFIRDDNGHFHIANGNTDFVLDPNGYFHLPQQAIDGGITNDGTEKLDVYNITSDGGKITSDGNGNLSVQGTLSVKLNTNLTSGLTVGGITSLNGIVNLTNTSGMITLRSQGTNQSWYMRRSANTVTSNTYTLMSSNNGTSSNNIYFYDDGNITSNAGTFVTKEYLASQSFVVNGDISTVGKSLSITIPNTTIVGTLTSTAAGGYAKFTYASSGDTLTNVDIRRDTMYGGGTGEAYSLDGGALTSTPLSIDDTIYMISNDSSIHFIRYNGHLYTITLFLSGYGARCSLIYNQIS